MKKLILLAILLPIIAQAATPAMTVKKLPACLSEQWLDDMMDFAQVRDYKSWDSYLEMNRCIILRLGLSVTVTDAGFIKHEFVYQGLKMWTPKEALRGR